MALVACVVSHLRGSHGLSTQSVWRTKSTWPPKGPKIHQVSTMCACVSLGAQALLYVDIPTHGCNWNTYGLSWLACVLLILYVDLHHPCVLYQIKNRPGVPPRVGVGDQHRWMHRLHDVLRFVKPKTSMVILKHRQNIASLRNKLAKLRRHASRVHFAKIHLI